jgi:hypothetical protein
MREAIQIADARVPAVSGWRLPNRYRTMSSVRLEGRSTVEGRRLRYVGAGGNPSPCYCMLEVGGSPRAWREAGWLQGGGGDSQTPPHPDPARRRARGGVCGHARLR